MDLQTMLRAVVRRWWVAVAVLVLTGVLAVMTAGAFPPTYFAEGEYLLVQGEGTQATGELIVSPTVIAAVAESRGFGEEPPSPFNQMPYQMVPVEGSSVISLTAVGSTQGDATEGVDLLLNTLEETVAELSGAATGAPEARVTLLGRGVASSAAVEEGDAAALAEFTDGFAATATALIQTTASPETSYGPSAYTASVLSTLISAPRNVDGYVDRQGVDDFSVTTDPRAPAPLLRIAVAGTDRDEVLQAHAAAHVEIAERLEELQAADVNRGATPTVVEALTRPDGPTMVENNLRRPLAVVILLGLFVALGAALSVDAMLLKRQARSDDDADSTADDASKTADIPTRQEDFTDAEERAAWTPSPPRR